jgi:iron complex transport system substrate-binding protein
MIMRKFFYSVFLCGFLLPLLSVHASTVVDIRGKSLVINKPVNRIVAIPIPVASMVIAIDEGGKRLTGIHPSASQSIKVGILGKIHPELRTIRDDIVQGTGFSANVESLLEMDADLVFQWSEPAKLLVQIEAAGLRVVGLRNNPPDQSSNAKNIQIIGEAIGKSKRAKTITDRQQRVLKQIEESALSTTPAPSALYLRASKPSFIPAGQDTYQNFWIKIAGGKNVAENLDGMSRAVSAEQIIAWDPEYIFLGSFDETSPADLYKNSALSSVRAIQRKQVYKMPHGGYRWDPGSQESHLTWIWAARILGRSKLSFDLRKEMRNEYRFLYGYDLTSSDIDDILIKKANALSRGYDAF